MKVYFWIGIICLTQACSSAARREALPDAIRAYHEGLVWQRFDHSAGKVTAAERDVFLNAHSELSDDLKVYGYEVVRTRMGSSRDEAKVHVKYTWYMESVGVVRKTHTVQTWARKGRVWIRMNEEHLRGPELPTVKSKPKVSAHLSSENK